MAGHKSDAAKAGIKINLVGRSFNAIIGESLRAPVGPKCTIQAFCVRRLGYDGPGFEPTGEPLFADRRRLQLGQLLQPDRWTS